MVIVQMRIEFRGNDQNHITLDVLEREDANAQERAMGRQVEALYCSIFEDIAAQLPGEVALTKIPPRKGKRARRAASGGARSGEREGER